MAGDALAAEPRIPVWLDCDPGHDDAIAIILAGYSPALDLLGISTVAGNQSVEKVTENARRVLHAAGLAGIPVVRGQGKPLLRDAMSCGEIHGDSGLDGPGGGPLLPPVPPPAPAAPPLALGPRGVDLIAQAIGAAAAAHGRRVRLIATGALTNVALLLVLYPELHPHLEVVFMGGALGTGNTAPVAEFNMQVDPEAADLVLRSGVPVTMVPLEVTHTALVTPAVAERVRGASAGDASPFRAAMHDLLHFFADTYKEVFGFEHPPLHDPCAVAYVIQPGLFKTLYLRVDVETHSVLSAGQTVTDVRRTTGRPPNAAVCLAMDVRAFWNLVLASIAAADAHSPLNRGANGLDR